MIGRKKITAREKKPVGPAKPVGGGFKPKMPMVPVKMPTTGGGTRGNVEQNYRGIPGLVNATAPDLARGKKPTPRMPTPVNPGGVGMTGFKNLVGAGSMAKMPTTGGAARRPDMSRIQKLTMKKGGAVKKAATKGSKK